jgi:agmatine/peptidylarginine deiminase
MTPGMQKRSALHDAGGINPDFRQLEKHSIDYELLCFTVNGLDPDKNWTYINFLQTDSLLLIPQFCLPEDQQALEALTRLFPANEATSHIAFIDASSLLQVSGAPNCISWTIKISST